MLCVGTACLGRSGVLLWLSGRVPCGEGRRSVRDSACSASGAAWDVDRCANVPGDGAISGPKVREEAVSHSCTTMGCRSRRHPGTWGAVTDLRRIQGWPSPSRAAERCLLAGALTWRLRRPIRGREMGLASAVNPRLSRHRRGLYSVAPCGARPAVRSGWPAQSCYCTPPARWSGRRHFIVVQLWDSGFQPAPWPRIGRFSPLSPRACRR